MERREISIARARAYPVDDHIASPPRLRPDHTPRLAYVTCARERYGPARATRNVEFTCRRSAVKESRCMVDHVRVNSPGSDRSGERSRRIGCAPREAVCDCWMEPIQPFYHARDGRKWNIGGARQKASRGRGRENARTWRGRVSCKRLTVFFVFSEEAIIKGKMSGNEGEQCGLAESLEHMTSPVSPSTGCPQFAASCASTTHAPVPRGLNRHVSPSHLLVSLLPSRALLRSNVPLIPSAGLGINPATASVCA
jgi:hypothetical protein